MKFIILVIVLLMVNCGGGSGQEIRTPPVETPPVQEEMMEPEIPESEREKPEEEAHDCYSTDQETLIDFLSEVTSRNGFVARWNRNPHLQVARGATEQEKAVVKESVRRLNEILPEQYEIEIRLGVTPLVEEVPEGSIYVDFAPVEDWVGACSGKEEEDVLGCADTPTLGTELGISHVWVVRLETLGKVRQCENGRVDLVTHELLHALGFMGGPDDGHPSSNWGMNTIMNRIGYHCDTPTSRRLHDFAQHGMDDPQEFEIAEVPGVLDRDALRAMYSLLENGDYPEELRVEPEQECK